MLALLLASSLTLSGSVELDARTDRRSENTLWLKAIADPDEHLRVRAELDVIYRADLGRFIIESDAAYLDFSSERVRIRAGRQILAWGAAPTLSASNPFNSLDLEDPLTFGEPIAHEMVLAELNTPWVRVSGAVQPIFVPALLPRFDTRDLLELYAPDEYATALALLDPDFQLSLRTRSPPRSLGHAPWALRAAGTVAGVDWALGAFSGREDLPVPRSITVADTRRGSGTLVHPPVREYFADLTYAFADFTVWAEATWVVHNRVTLILESPLGVQGVVQLDEPYLRAVVGGDWQGASERGLIVGAQFIRGFLDEIAADDVEHYMFTWADAQFARNRLGFRLFGGVSLADGSTILVPEARARPTDDLEIRAGAFFPVGGVDTKFGNPVLAQPVVYLKAQLFF